MKYSGNINYIKCLEYGLNLSQGAVMDLLTHLSTWAEGKEIEGEIYYYLSSSKMIEELPLISQDRSTFLKIIQGLKSKDLIKHILFQNKSRYNLTNKGKSFVGKLFDEKYESVEKNLHKCGKNSTPSVENFPHNNNTSNNTTSINKNNNISNDILLEKKEFFEKENLFDLLKNLFLDLEFLEKLKNKFGVENEDLKSSAENFLIYWTEKNPNGKKEKRQMQKVFDIKKRFYTRISNNNKFSKNKQIKKTITFG